MYGFRNTPESQTSEYGQAGQAGKLLSPSTMSVHGAFAAEANSGIGTRAADVLAEKINQYDASEEPLTEEQYINSPFFSSNVAWYRGMSESSAFELKQFDDDTQRHGEYIGAASSSQFASGLAVGFLGGMVEEKNVAIGLATSMVLTPLAGAASPAAGSLRRLVKMREAAGNYGTKIGLGVVEGGVSAAIAEPSNRYSAGVLQQDYTMADSAWNVATSAAFGAAASVGGIGAKKVPEFIRNKIEKHRSRTMDVVATEFDLATQQLSAGQKVDVSAVEAAEVGKVSGRPVSEQVRAAENFVRFNESPEFKARFEGSKVVDAEGKPLRVYHGTDADFEQFATRGRKAAGGELGTGAYFTNKEAASTYSHARSDVGSNVRPVYLNLKNPFDVTGLDDIPSRAQLVKRGYDGIIDTGGIDRGVNREPQYVAFSPEQIIPAFGDKTLPEITAKIDQQNATTIQKHNAATLDPRNDTVIDYDAIDAIDERRAIQEVDAEAQAEAYLEEAEAEIQMLLDQEILNEADLAEYQSALEELQGPQTKSALEILQTCLTRG